MIPSGMIFALQEFSPKIPVEQKCASRNDAYSLAVKLSLRDRARRGVCAIAHTFCLLKYLINGIVRGKSKILHLDALALMW